MNPKRNNQIKSYLNGNWKTDPDSMQFLMNDEQKQHLESINERDTRLSCFYHLFPKDLIADLAY